MSEFDSKSSLELLDLTCEIVVSVDPDASSILKDTTEYRVDRLIDFYTTMKFSGAIQVPSFVCSFMYLLVTFRSHPSHYTDCNRNNFKIQSFRILRYVQNPEQFRSLLSVWRQRHPHDCDSLDAAKV